MVWYGMGMGILHSRMVGNGWEDGQYIRLRFGKGFCAVRLD